MVAQTKVQPAPPRVAASAVAALTLLAPVRARGDRTAASLATAPQCPAVSLTRTGSSTRSSTATTTGAPGTCPGGVGREHPDPIEYPVRSDEWTKGCVIGGTILGNIPRTWTREQWYDGEGVDILSSDAFRQTMTDTPGNFLVIKDAYVEDFEDAYDPNSGRSTRRTWSTCTPGSSEMTASRTRTCRTTW